MNMHSEPHTWPEWLNIFHSWWRGETPIGAVLLAIVMASLRVAYNGGGRRKMLLEGLLCGALTLSAASTLQYFDLPYSLAIAIGGGIGFIGVEQFRKIITGIINNRFGGK
ncbi:phage holin, lambda family [Mixta intestinalis]|nr:phage holin, lambda family [Mixta intestinalis]